MGTYALLGEAGGCYEKTVSLLRDRCRVWQIVGKVLTL